MKLIAMHSIYLDSNEFEATGRYDRDGTAILQKVPRIAYPGTPFEIDDAEGLELIEREAARELTEQELQFEARLNA